MKLSLSNIAWSAEYDHDMYAYLQQTGFAGIEIAPSRLFGHAPYAHIAEAAEWARSIRDQYGLAVSSMQSIWYGKTENIFGTQDERLTLVAYTKQAINFAVSAGCPNLVFGCPKNRNMPRNTQIAQAYDFFAEIAEYAASRNTTIALEPNPPIYHTNFINTTAQAFDFVKTVGVSGLAVNVDVGTVIENAESLTAIAENMQLVHHVHISEPKLVEIKHRELHKTLRDVLHSCKYDQYISVEMGNFGDIEPVRRAALYMRDVFA